MATAPTRPRGRPLAPWQNQIPAALFDDATVCTLTAMQRLLLVALIARADRLGRGMARPSKLREGAFDGLEISDLETAQMFHGLVDQLRGSRFELVTYEVDRNPYYAFPRWLEWQNMEYVPKTSQYPPPPGSGTEEDPPTSPPESSHGSADLPAGTVGATVAGVPTSGTTASPGANRAEPGQTARQHGSADLPAIEAARRSPEYREYEEACRNAELDRWLSHTAFETLFAACLETGREWQVVIEAVNETGRGASGGKPPSPRYGARIIRELPPDIRTRDQARAYLEDPNRKRATAGGGTGGNRSNVILRRDQPDEGEYDYIYNKFRDGPKPGAAGVT
ncbi:MAG: hypothetical protein ACOY93_08590 [Bacillota bacterium]